MVKQLFILYYRPLCLYALHYVHDLDQAEDLVSECFCKYCELKKDIQVGEGARAYLYKMVRYACIDFLKEQRMLVADPLPTDFEGPLTDEDCERQTLVEARLWTVIDELPDRCREIFLMNKRDGLKYKEIAERLNISVHTVENQIIKALKRLRASASRIYHYFFG